MPVISAKKKPSLYQRFFGDEKSRFAEGIKRRREKTEETDPSEYFFDPATSEFAAPSIMMTRYLTKEGIPNVARRMQGTQQFLKDVIGSVGPSAETAARLFAERYPRVAAHMAITGKTADKFKSKGVRGVTHGGTRDVVAPERTPISINKAFGHGGEIEETLLHEGTHVAQELGQKGHRGITPAYLASENALKKLGYGAREAYNLNPFEISARQTAMRKMGQNLEPFSAHKNIDELVQRLPAGSPERIELARYRRRR